MKGNIQCPRLIKGSLLDFVLETMDVFVNGSKNDCELVNFNYKERKVVSRYSTKFERNSKLRKEQLISTVKVVRYVVFDFERNFMGHRESFIEVHHIKSMFTIRKLK
ncbi:MULTISPECIES: hypothetical protein [Staphylococcus]|uniref:hypothetical protein n=1 Tax=Staphylococcus TaxID=1279 RepID=UPI002DBF46F1|nr:hypothetical protein [Staphylococcus equorum]MEB7672523.1 hypothetical protein [Staphylococcus equorum]MEB7788360.1 hypothetical protein [Staphylococcus equorum]